MVVADDPGHDQHDAVDREQAADDAADVEAVGGAGGRRLVDVGLAGRRGDGAAEGLVCSGIGLRA